MMRQIPEVLTKAEVAALRGVIDAGTWIDGNKTSGFQAALAKSNLQLDHASPEGLEAGRRITAALRQGAQTDGRRPRSTCRGCPRSTGRARHPILTVDRFV